MLHKEDFEHIGTLGRAHGIHGEISARLTVELSGLDEEARQGLFLLLEEDGLLIPYRVTQLRSKGRDLDLLTFAGITTKEAAEALAGRSVWLDRAYIDQEQAEELLGVEHYVGYSLYSAGSEQAVGQVIAVDETTINTLLSVLTPRGEELILPFSEELIERVDVATHRLYLQIAEGLLELG